MAHVRKGDLVVVISGASKGKTGPSLNWLNVKGWKAGCAMVGPPGGILQTNFSERFPG